MASFGHSNPHSGSKDSRSDRSPLASDLPRTHADVVKRWGLCKGDAISTSSKRMMAVAVGGKEFILADVRFARVTNRGKLVLEMFYDGELNEIGGENSTAGLSEFLKSVQESLSVVCNEYYRTLLTQAAQKRGSLQLASFKAMRYPDTVIEPDGSTLQDAFRDAGCMLSFIALKVCVSPECAECIGGIVFPTYFGFEALCEVNVPVPKWLLGLGAVTVVFCVATVFAWSQILLYGNQYSY